MKLSSQCDKCGDIFSQYAENIEAARQSFEDLVKWDKEHTHYYPRAKEPARGPGRPKKDSK